jgi:hypothetical protein
MQLFFAFIFFHTIHYRHISVEIISHSWDETWARFSMEPVVWLQSVAEIFGLPLQLGLEPVKQRL